MKKETTSKGTTKDPKEKEGVIEINLENEELYKIKGETLLAIMNSLNLLESLIKVPCIQVKPIIGKIAQDINDNK